MKEYRNHIIVDPEIMMGKPVIAGTRIPVEMILRDLGVGIAPEELLRAYPQRTMDDIRAAQACESNHEPADIRQRPIR
ncbi:DUF433 domain-containing protein [Thermopetrobacter sp. TC1]|uniref:DUF433 domain-containing protein n=1 Tax=Thermopetrobacter sp. TC1 TaxID=1495045 RepID=UPI00056EF6D3|nr:DUF433 domain-containing protein [Thermopetrobacter sp. TC1]